ncbi:carbohydrate kinase [Isoptericola sp. NPDC019693]|uniref:carbohydrate kinase family protein n=1 Tax=Isoptericola sp. NPDC019693 TaxID=3364009 RepID=UPI0037A887C9
MSEFLVVGEALVDIVEDRSGARAHHPGGSPANVALGLARLGGSVDLLTWLARDQAGAGVVDHLEASGVTVLPESLGGSRTSSALARLDADGGATYEFDLEWHLAPAVPGHDARVVHAGSIAAVADTVPADALLRMVHDARRSATITYDPNLRPSIMGDAEAVRARVDALVAAADVVKVSEEDLGWLHPDAAPLDVASSWADDLGCAVVVVTHGGRGATAVRAHGHPVVTPARPVTVVDTVGAGDSFMSGLLAALHGRGLTGADRRDALRRVDTAALEAVLDFASRAAAVTVSRAGANPPHLAEL